MTTLAEKPKIAVREKPILFSGPMVRAILEGRKTMTRRVVKPVLGPQASWTPWENVGWRPGGLIADIPTEAFSKILYSPYGEAGDHLWVKEMHWRYGIWQKNGLTSKGRQRWRFKALPHDLGVQFSAPEAPPKRGRKGWHKRPSIFMPRSTSRITLEITRVRVERLQEISEDDAKSEGAPEPTGKLGFYPAPWATSKPGALNYRESFKALWDSINGKTYPWESNPFVFVIEFKKL